MSICVLCIVLNIEINVSGAKNLGSQLITICLMKIISMSISQSSLFPCKWDFT
jgi:hypothetical protein